MHAVCTKHKMCVTALQVVMFMWATPASLLAPIDKSGQHFFFIYSVLFYFKALLYLSFHLFLSQTHERDEHGVDHPRVGSGQLCDGDASHSRAFN